MQSLHLLATEIIGMMQGFYTPNSNDFDCLNASCLYWQHMDETQPNPFNIAVRMQAYRDMPGDKCRVTFWVLPFRWWKYLVNVWITDYLNRSEWPLLVNNDPRNLSTKEISAPKPCIKQLLNSASISILQGELHIHLLSYSKNTNLFHTISQCVLYVSIMLANPWKHSFHYQKRVKLFSPFHDDDRWAEWGQFLVWWRSAGSSCAGWRASSRGSSVCGEHPLWGSNGARVGA